MFYERNKVYVFVICIITLILSIFNVGCASDNLPPIKEGEVYKDFSVNYLDVGQGDCIFIRLPDGKNFLIDSGLNDENSENSKFIINFLKRYSVSKIDYFVLTHPDLDHIGNAKDIINNFSIGTIYLPIISQKLMSNFEHYKMLLDLIEQKQINSVISDYFCAIKGEEYAIAFLSPATKGLNDSSYSELDNTLNPTDRQINDLSPIIYFECFDNRFVFTGDASNIQERIVLKNYDVGLYDWFSTTYGIDINLEDIDYLKVSHHGADGATCEEFISLLNPKNFIFSVGKENFYGHPKTEVIERILGFCPNSLMYRTDQVGTISVHKDKQNKIVVSTTK